MDAQDEERRLVAAMATGLWRVRKRLLDAGDDPGRPEWRSLIREIESLWDRMADAGLEVIDHTGEPYDPGKSFEVIAFQPTPGAHEERVLETYRPTIYHRSHRLQMGQVVISLPESSLDPANEE